MKRLKKHIFIRCAALMVMVVYFFIAVAFLFFAPEFQYARSKADTGRIKTDTQLIYSLIRTSRCIANNNKSEKVLVKQGCGFFIQHLTGMNSLHTLWRNKPYFTFFLPDHHFSYLFCRVLRI